MAKISVIILLQRFLSNNIPDKLRSLTSTSLDDVTNDALTVDDISTQLHSRNIRVSLRCTQKLHLQRCVIFPSEIRSSDCAISPEVFALIRVAWTRWKIFLRLLLVTGCNSLCVRWSGLGMLLPVSLIRTDLHFPWNGSRSARAFGQSVLLLPCRSLASNEGPLK